MSAVIFFLLTFLIACAAAVAVTESLLSAVLIQLGYSTITAVLWLILESPDLAITEAAVGAGVTGILFFVTLRKIEIIGGKMPKKAPKKESTQLDRIYTVLSIIICGTLIYVLLLTVSYLPSFGNGDNPAMNEVYQRYVENGLAETGAVNIVAGMILDYRAFDTLGESNVLFIAVCSVIILLRADKNKKTGLYNIPQLENRHRDKFDDDVMRGTAYVIVPIGILYGIYVILNGHLSAGGGFSGGAIIGAALILYVNAFGSAKLDKFFTFNTYKWISFAALITYTLLKTYSFYTGANHLESGIPLGTPGAILSSGLILPLNICVGLVVACTMYAFYSLFSRGGFSDGN